ncbi:MAG: hypothetical protein KBD37_00235 [Burkholderiales bacterium]|nr:hypothetical protein [Burkholderiales bacterium]
MSALQSEDSTQTNYQELDNIATNIEQKIKLLDIKLPKLAEMAEVDYFSLRKIVNRENNYMPNLRILIKLASFFNITTGDLISYNRLPQYISTIKLEQIEDFLNDKIPEFELQNKVFCEHYIHEHAFAIEKPLLNFNIQALVNHICYPTNKFYKDGIFIVTICNQNKFIQVHTIKDNIVYFNDGDTQNTMHEQLEYVKPIAVVVKFILNQSLI